jgi:hypothetical protein
MMKSSYSLYFNKKVCRTFLERVNVIWKLVVKSYKSNQNMQTIQYYNFLTLFLNYYTLTLWDFITIILHMYTVYLEQVHLMYYISILPSHTSFQTVFVGFHYALLYLISWYSRNFWTVFNRILFGLRGSRWRTDRKL